MGFQEQWNGKTIKKLFQMTRNLNHTCFDNVVLFLLHTNDIQEGLSEGSHD
ncbi:Hypothetical protein PAU_03477 [Photorhabdus asymbiotica]|uniref:Uncharacterized protein n=1 Tax=Photorhabdus asymbiotica subsp. asymbiotica (strain ATCC 43949 / 3105-77) TaxID=553480 RepID=C7BJP0_PHOAA|nr:Hypothetical protein PAU_03477 [Photorhabdus asymbiotica]